MTASAKTDINSGKSCQQGTELPASGRLETIHMQDAPGLKSPQSEAADG